MRLVIEKIGKYWEDCDIVTKLNEVIERQNEIVQFILCKCKLEDTNEPKK